MLHEGEYKPNRFTPVVAAMELSEYVFLITDNANKFPEYTTTEKATESGKQIVIMMRQDALVNRVREQAYQIYILAWTANEINLDKHPERKSERLDRERQAIELCNEHLAAIQLCRKRFRLSYKKIRYWGGLAFNVRNLLEKWNESDRNRYADI